MKKIHSVGLEKIFLFCGFSLALTLAGFWQFQHNVSEAEKLSRVQNGVGTCFSRVTQTFTAAMIREFTSPYLKRDFMALSDECLSEGTKSAGIEIGTFPKAGKLFNELVSEVYWFHEKVVKVLGASAGQPNVQIPLNAISEKYAKVETLKLDLQDQLDLISSQYREARLRDEILVGVAFLLFMASLGVLGLKEAALLRHKRAVESQALSLLNAGHSQIGAMVDQMVQKALTGQGMPISAQVFADYHGSVLEHLAFRLNAHQAPVAVEVKAESVLVEKIQEPAVVIKATDADVDARKLLTAQAVRLKASMEVQEAFITADAEALAQLLQAFGQRFSSGEVHLLGTRDGDNYCVRVLADNICLNAAELNYVSSLDASMEGVDVNVVIAMDLIRESGIEAQVRNRTNTTGAIVGAEAMFNFPVNTGRTLVTVVKGKKKDLAKSMAPSLFN
jgi:hypothetical protein